MQAIKVEKITLNIGAGKDQTKLERGILLLKNITGIDPVKTFTNKRIPTWGLRPGLPIGCKITLRKEKAVINALWPHTNSTKAGNRTTALRPNLLWHRRLYRRDYH